MKVEIAKVLFFSRKNKKYVTQEGLEITTEMIMKYPHVITDNTGFIIIASGQFEYENL